MTFDPASPETSAAVTPLPGMAGVGDNLSCSSAQRCVSVTSTGRVAVIDPNDPKQARGTGTLPAENRDVASAMPARCVAASTERLPYVARFGPRTDL
jgi:hypothetical protein